MKRNLISGVTAVVVLAVYSSGCLDREPTPVCPVPIKVSSNKVHAGNFDGVDLLVVIDNSNSMAEEQQILATSFFTLINSLNNPLPKPHWNYPKVDNMRVAFVTSDLGLQYGETEKSIDGAPVGVSTCGDLVGDDGNFVKKLNDVTTITVNVNSIRCSENGGQCPDGIGCGNIDNGAGNCIGSEAQSVNCVVPDTQILETTQQMPNNNLSTQVACTGMQGTAGCGFEQQLEGAWMGLKKNPEFIKDKHVLAVLMVSDEEDCSLANNQIFSSANWSDPRKQNIACNYPPESNINFLINTTKTDGRDGYKEKYLSLKDNNTSAVVFAAIVGVPTAQDAANGGLPMCEGTGVEIANCLENNPMMEIRPIVFAPDTPGAYEHFAFACQRLVNDRAVTEARPGRRFVEVAQSFGETGYVFSICNENWSPAMEKIADIIARQMKPSCFDEQLEWSELPAARQPEGCTNCGEADCDVVFREQRAVNADTNCNAQVYAGLSDAEKRRYEAKKQVVKAENEKGEIDSINVFCALPKLPLPLDCVAAEARINPNDIGWYYCEEAGEDFADACKDGKDNNENGYVDCDDQGCAACCATDEQLENCNSSKCRFGVKITEAAKNLVKGEINVQCLQSFKFEDENCREDSPSACYDAKDAEDEDGNGSWNCTWGLENNPHKPDPYCCPMDEPKMIEGRRICQPKVSAAVNNCYRGMARHYTMDPTIPGDAQGALTGIIAELDGNIKKGTEPNKELRERLGQYWSYIPACAQHAKDLGCAFQ